MQVMLLKALKQDESPWTGTKKDIPIFQSPQSSVQPFIKITDPEITFKNILGHEELIIT